MDTRITGMVECWREGGAWHMTIRLPRWVVDDIEHEANGFRICGVGHESRGNGDGAAVTPFGATLSLVATPRTRQTKEPQDAPTSAGQSTGESGPETPDADTMPNGAQNPPRANDFGVLGGGGIFGEGNYTSSAITPSRNTHTHVLGPFSFITSDYRGTGLPHYLIRANLDMTQLAEVASHAELPPGCVIELTRSIPRGGRDMDHTTLYHYLGPGHDPGIRRITSVMLRRWIEGLRAAIGEAV